MDNADKFLFFSNGFTFCLLNILFYFLRRYVGNKPPGSQSLYEVAKKDSYLIVQIASSLFTLTATLSRLDIVAQCGVKHQLIVQIACSGHFFAFVTLCVNVSSLSIVRICCIVNLRFIEESVGERRIRTILFVVPICMALAACVTIMVFGDTKSGICYNLITGKVATQGKHS